MGIRGLSTYMLNNSERYLQNYELHDTDLVIDGNNIAHELYKKHGSNCIFGGDYGKYAQYVTNFFDELLICNVRPMVLMDGGWEDDKFHRILPLIEREMQGASNHMQYLQHRKNSFPLSMLEIFKNVMDEKKIKYAQCIFEADPTIAAVSRLLNCPVLSCDSDFYTYGSSFIPFTTWENNPIRNSIRNNYVIRCKIYKPETLFQVFEGLNQPLLSVAAVLLRKDIEFENFFHHLPTTKINNEEHERIEAVLTWLSKRSLNQAIIEILSTLRTRYKQVLYIMKSRINSYANALHSVLPILNILLKDLSKISEFKEKKLIIYEFKIYIYNLPYIMKNYDNTRINNNNQIEIIGTLRKTKLISNESLIENLPEWFLDEYNQGKFPSYFIDILLRQLYVSPVQIEDFSRASPVFASLKIIRVIHGLLKGVDGTCIIRDEKKTIKYYPLKYIDNILGHELPTLHNVRKLALRTRRRILNAILLETEEETSVNEFPFGWQLYILVIKFWLNQQGEETISTEFSCYIYSLLLAILLNVIDKKIKFYTNMKNFQHEHNKLRHIQNVEIIKDIQPQFAKNNKLVDAINRISTDDCKTAAMFFMSNFEIDQKLSEEPKQFNITIVHTLAAFQSCINNSIHLNALLGCPYQQTKIANFYNGTLVYNLYTNLIEHENVEAYIYANLQNSPSLLQLFNLLLLKVKSFGILMDNNDTK